MLTNWEKCQTEEAAVTIACHSWEIGGCRLAAMEDVEKAFSDDSADERALARLAADKWLDEVE